MKYSICFLFTTINLYLVTTSILSQGWQWQNPQPFGDPIEQVLFVDDQHGWMAPQNTTLLRTTDGGEDWEIIYTDLIFSDIHFVNPQTGWGLGRSYFGEGRDNIYHTIDGGLTWEIQIADVKGASGGDIYFLDSLNGWATGSLELYHTNNGGVSWEKQAENQMFTYSGVTFIDTVTGWAVGDLSWGIHTTDGGKTWERDSALAGAKQIIFTDTLHLWGFSDAWFVWRSINGGETWDKISITDTLVEVRGSDITALDNYRVFAATNIGIFASSNGGLSWNFYSEQSINNFHFINEQEIWAAGGGSTASILHSLDGGQTWKELITDNKPQGSIKYKAIDFIDTQIGWIIPGYPRTMPDSVILQTTNGGLTWVEQHSNTINSLNNLNFLNENMGWVVGENGTILHTTDGGQTWLPQTSGVELALNTVCFVNEHTGWAVGGEFVDNNFKGVIIHTIDGGQTWVDQTPGFITRLTSASFVDSLTGWVVGGGGSLIDGGVIMHTSDGGQNWIIQRQHPNLEMYDVIFVDTLYGWAIGYDPIVDATVIHTTDGGQTWTGQGSEVINPISIKFVDREYGWIVGLSGRIYHTNNGGQTWLRQRSYTSRSLLDVDFVNRNTGWTVGWQGTILHTNSGGITGINRPIPNQSVDKFQLHQNYPNPFNPSTSIEIVLPIDSPIRLEVYDIAGRKVRTLISKHLPIGTHQVIWDGRNESGQAVGSGVYLYRLNAGDFVQTRKMILMR